MALPLDIQRVLQIIDQRIAVFRQTKKMILHEFSEDKGDSVAPFQLKKTEEPSGEKEKEEDKTVEQNTPTP